MGENLNKILCKTTKKYTVRRMKALLQKAKMQYKDYTNTLIDAEKEDYENELINEVEEANVDNPLHDKLDDLEDILKGLVNDCKEENIEINLQRAYKEFSNGFCNKCVDYLDREKLREELIQSILGFECQDKDMMNKIVEEWINNLMR